MLSVSLITILAVILVSSISLVGVLVLLLGEKKIEDKIFFLVSFATGGLLGDTFLHLLPETVERQGLELSASLSVLLGIIFFFILEKYISWRHCHVLTSPKHPHPVVFMNLVGDGVHNFIDGTLIAASFLVSIPLGLSTSLAIMFHEIPQELGEFGILVHGGFSPKKALFFNFLSGLIALAGAVFVLLIGVRFKSLLENLIPFTAGGFIYVAGSDLIPELHKEVEVRKSFVQLLGIIMGIGIMLFFTFL